MKRIIGILVCMAVLTLLIGCGKETSGQGDEKPTLKVLQMYYKENLNDNKIAKLLEERTGYNVEYETLPLDKPYDKLNILMSSADSYDTVVIGNNKNVFAEYAASGALLALDDLIDSHGINMKQAISEKTFSMTKVDNKIYGIPNLAGGSVSAGIFVRLDWIEKLGLQIPETVDEFTDMLRAFKQHDPGGNGNRNIPLVINGGSPFITNVIGAFGLASGWTDVDGKLVPTIMRPEVKDYYSYAQQLYQEGLLDEEFPVNKTVTSREKFTSGRAGAMVLGWFEIPTVVSAIKNTTPDAKVGYLPVLKNSMGQAGLSVTGTGLDKIAFIPRNAKNPIDAMKWLDAKLEPETFKLFTIGEEDVHHQLKDGSYYPIAPTFFEERDVSSVFLTGIDERVYSDYWQARIRKDVDLYEGWDFLNNQSPNKDYMVIDKSTLSPCIPEFSKNIAIIEQMLVDFSLNVIVGKESIDAVDGFIERWKDEGGQQAYDAINNWYAGVKDSL